MDARSRPACVTPDDQTLASRATCRCTGPTPAGSSAPKHLLLKVWWRRPAQAIGESRTSGSRPRRVLPPALAARCQMVLVGAHRAIATRVRECLSGTATRSSPQAVGVLPRLLSLAVGWHRVLFLATDSLRLLPEEGPCRDGRGDVPAPDASGRIGPSGPQGSYCVGAGGDLPAGRDHQERLRTERRETNAAQNPPGTSAAQTHRGRRRTGQQRTAHSGIARSAHALHSRREAWRS